MSRAAIVQPSCGARYGRCGVLLLALLASLGDVYAAEPSCQPRVLARCVIDMSRDAVRALFPAAKVEVQKYGTRVLTANSDEAFPRFHAAGVLRVTFDERLLVSEVRFTADGTGADTRTMTTTESAWGTSSGTTWIDAVDHSSSASTHWDEYCNTIGNLYVSISGQPPVSKATWVLVRFTP